jgi:ABC-type arginine/histidine transport system permease subunit
MLNGKELPIISDTSTTESKGYISYRRNEVIETTSLRRSATTVHTQINLPELDNQVIHLTGSTPLSAQYIRKIRLIGKLAQCIRSVSVRKVQLLLLASVIFIILGFVTKIINQ